jgi:hypothetical protein
MVMYKYTTLCTYITLYMPGEMVHKKCMLLLCCYVAEFFFDFVIFRVPKFSYVVREFILYSSFHD